MSAFYDQEGIRFMYPENWTITDEDLKSAPQTVSVQSPGTGFWTLMVYEDPVDPQDLTEQIVETMREEYESLESSDYVDEFADIRAKGHAMYFYCLDLVISSRVLAVQAGARTLLILWQAEDQEFDKVEPVFRAMTTSLLETA